MCYSLKLQSQLQLSWSYYTFDLPFQVFILKHFLLLSKGGERVVERNPQTENMRFIWFLGVITAQNADYYTFDESYESSGSTEQQQMTECTGNSCDLSVNFPTLAIRLPSNQIVQSLGCFY